MVTGYVLLLWLVLICSTTARNNDFYSVSGPEWKSCDGMPCIRGFVCVMRLSGPGKGPLCVKSGPDTCELVDCRDGMKCIHKEVVCIRAPCYPEPECVPINGNTNNAVNPCSTTVCSPGLVCNAQDGRAYCVSVPPVLPPSPKAETAKKPEQPEHQSDTVNPCAFTSCLTGSDCINVNGEGKCVKPGTTPAQWLQQQKGTGLYTETTGCTPPCRAGLVCSRDYPNASLICIKPPCPPIQPRCVEQQYGVPVIPEQHYILPRPTCLMNPCNMDSVCIDSSTGANCIAKNTIDPPQKLSCANVLCMVYNKCVEEPSGPKCVPVKKCSETKCPDGQKCVQPSLGLDAVCEPTNTSLKCQQLKCSEGQICDDSSPSAAYCRLPHSCENMKCPPKYNCRMGNPGSDAECVPPCSKNDVLNECGGCDSTCDVFISCTADCVPTRAACSCRGVMVRGPHGVCIEQSDCPKKIVTIGRPLYTTAPTTTKHPMTTTINPCYYRKCSAGHHCVARDGTSFCETDPSREKCNIFCPFGQRCEIGSMGIPQCVPDSTIPSTNPVKGVCNLLCIKGSRCVIDSTGRPTCIPLLTCASTLCITGSTCIDSPTGPTCATNPANTTTTTKPKICPSGEIWKDCSNTCEAFCGDEAAFRICPEGCGKPKCECDMANGYKRNPEGRCVLRQQCPNFQEFPTLTCDNALCRPGYRCVETPSGPNCIPSVPPEKCAVGEEWKECSSYCESQCGVDDRVCILSCGPPMCQCASGNARNNDGKCIPRSHCCSPPCRDGSVCKAQTIFCIRAPCPQPPPKCVPEMPTKKVCSPPCQPGFVCLRPTFNCVREPCPQPNPECVPKPG